jgi:hypothetical protein
MGRKRIINLSNKMKDKLKLYESAITDKKYSYNDRLLALHKILLSTYDWITNEFINIGLPQEDIDSELYFLTDDILSNYDENKSSLIPYIERAIYWNFSNRAQKLEKEQLGKYFELQEYMYNNISEYSIPDILLDDKYNHKFFTRGQKYLIYRILNEDSDITIRKLSNKLNLSREKLIEILNNIKEILQDNGGY